MAVLSVPITKWPMMAFWTSPSAVRDTTAGIGNIDRSVLVDDFRGLVAQLALGADTVDLNYASLVSGDTGEVGTVENGVLQGDSFQEDFFALLFVDDLERAVHGVCAGSLFAQPQITQTRRF